MLILKRRSGEKIFIGDDIEIIVVGIEKRSIKLGIDAPASVNIVREELMEISDNDEGDNN